MKLHELIADVIRDYKAPSLETLREWELMAIDQGNAIDLINGMAGKVIIDQSEHELIIDFKEFLRWHMGADWLNRILVKFIEWKEKQDGGK